MKVKKRSDFTISKTAFLVEKERDQIRLSVTLLKAATIDDALF